MKKALENSLAIFGCSWSKPVELNYTNNGLQVTEQETYGFLLKEMFGSRNYKNLAIEGSSNSRSLLQLLNYVREYPNELAGSIAIFQITAPERDCYIDEKCVVDLRLGKPDQLSADYYKLYKSSHYFDFNLHKNLLSMQSICRSYQINDYYIAGWSDIDFCKTGIDMSRIYAKTFAQLFGYKDCQDFIDGVSNQYVLNCKHPSALGHKLVADTLYNWIVNDINPRVYN